MLESWQTGRGRVLRRSSSEGALVESLPAGCAKLCLMRPRKRSRTVWTIVTVVSLAVSGFLIFVLRTGTCFDPPTGSGACVSGPDPAGLLLGLLVLGLAVFAFVRALRG